jgi:hypothetical protein
VISSPDMANSNEHSWLSVCGVNDSNLERDLVDSVAQMQSQAGMPTGEAVRVAGVSTAIATGSFTVTPERLELLRSLCHLYSAGIRAEKISSHRPFIGPVIVFVKKAVFRVVSGLLGPTFRYQRDFNAGVIRLLGDLCNEDKGRD